MTTKPAPTAKKKSPTREIITRRETDTGGQYTLSCNHLVTTTDYKPKITELACPHCTPE